MFPLRKKKLSVLLVLAFDSESEYEFVTKKDELPELKGVEFDGDKFSVTVSDAITLPGQLRKEGVMKWKIGYPGDKGDSGLIIVWDKSVFRLGPDEDHFAQVSTLNAKKVNVNLDGGGLALTNEITSLPNKDMQMVVSPVKKLSPNDVFNFTIAPIDNTACDLKLEFDGSKYGLLKKKIRTTPVPTVNPANVSTSAMTWGIVGGVIGILVCIGISIGVYCYYVRRKKSSKGSGTTGKSGDNVISQPDAVVVAPSSADCQGEVFDDKKLVTCTDRTVNAEADVFSDPEEPEKKQPTKRIF
uniref:Uncharacterized protein n=1 Tax=Ditylenchus dipsaci TaxID=166011 RepID=A0A915CWQ7_9BILA